jgi:alpha,alpha-trehalase
MRQRLHPARAGTGSIREKYNGFCGSANVAVATGDKSNVLGFGWTNGVSLALRILAAGQQP